VLSSIAPANWLGSVLSVLLLVQVAAVIVIWCIAAAVALTARDDKHAERALEVFRILWSSRRRR
jgi:hypothetical protein